MPDKEPKRRHKETAFLAQKLTQHIKTNHDYMDFRSLHTALSFIERRYSYAQIYQAADLASVICENLTLWPGKSIQITSNLVKCAPSPLEGIIIKLIEIDQNNYRFNIQITNDQNYELCKNTSENCSFWIGLGDRLESTPYKHQFLAEYIGYSQQCPDWILHGAIKHIFLDYGSSSVC